MSGPTAYQPCEQGKATPQFTQLQNGVMPTLPRAILRVNQVHEAGPRTSTSSLL